MFRHLRTATGEERAGRGTTSGPGLGDRVAAAVLLAVLAPTLLALAALVRTLHGRPVLVYKPHPAPDGPPGTLLAFRTDGQRSARLAVAQPAGWLGQALSRTSLDELPGLIDVVRGRRPLLR